MKVNIVLYKENDSWIIEKFAIEMDKNLKILKIQSNISNKPDMNADINHHLIYHSYNGLKSTIDTLMITHVDSFNKYVFLKKIMQTTDAGICMSNETMVKLEKMGIESNKTCYVNPAHDGKFVIKKITIGIASRIYPDGRKNEVYLNKLAKEINPLYFKFKIIGNGWEPQVKYLIKNNFEVEYLPEFDYEKYTKFIPSLDFYLYMGSDEGQMGFVDALAAGVKTIVIPQGYHLDAKNGIIHPFNSYNELKNILLKLQDEKETLISSVVDWNWYNYTKKHVEIWQYLIDGEKINSDFPDGVNSLWEQTEYDEIFEKNELSELKKNGNKQKLHKLIYLIKTFDIVGLAKQFKIFLFKSFNVSLVFSDQYFFQ